MIGKIPQISTNLTLRDYLGTIKVRLGFNRDNYKVKPGIYAVGSPEGNSNVFVSANYKLSFDVLRKSLCGLNAWILVLDTRGINVWCAAGKGTFGTKELVHRIKISSLEKIINHKRIILPQLGAAGVSAHQVKALSGFNVIYGPIRATDIKDFLQANLRATKDMRRISFSFYDRLKLIPNDFMFGIKYLALILFLIFIISGIKENGISFLKASKVGFPIILNIFIGYLTGIFITPMLLPYIPVRSFSFKGFITGIAISFILFITQMLGTSTLAIISWFLFIPALSSFIAMNFTGSSTYTSLSGVRKEMKFAVPVQVSLGSLAFILFITSIII